VYPKSCALDYAQSELEERSRCSHPGVRRALDDGSPCVHCGTLVVAASATAQVMTTSPSPSQASSSQASPMQIDFAAIITYSGGAQRSVRLFILSAQFERSWTQQRPVTLDGKTLDVPGRIITGNTVVDGIDLAAALNRKRH
jgi:hypothetical protein